MVWASGHCVEFAWTHQVHDNKLVVELVGTYLHVDFATMRYKPCRAAEVRSTRMTNQQPCGDHAHLINHGCRCQQVTTAANKSSELVAMPWSFFTMLDSEEIKMDTGTSGLECLQNAS